MCVCVRVCLVKSIKIISSLQSALSHRCSEDYVRLLGVQGTTAVSHQGEVHFLTDVFRVGIDLPIVLVSSISHVESALLLFTHGMFSELC